MYDLERFIAEKHQGGQTVTVDWGLGPPVVGLSQQKLQVSELWFDLSQRERSASQLRVAEVE